jgi:hypothetical protein
MDEHVTALVRIVDTVRNERDPKQRLCALTNGFMAIYVPASSRHKVLLNDLDKPGEEAAGATRRRHDLFRLDQLDAHLARSQGRTECHRGRRVGSRDVPAGRVAALRSIGVADTRSLWRSL